MFCLCKSYRSIVKIKEGYETQKEQVLGGSAGVLYTRRKRYKIEPLLKGHLYSLKARFPHTINYIAGEKFCESLHFITFAAEGICSTVENVQFDLSARKNKYKWRVETDVKGAPAYERNAFRGDSVLPKTIW